MVRCYELLDATSRSFAAVIQALDPELRPAICVFYLVLRGLDTVEDDMTIDLRYVGPRASLHRLAVSPASSLLAAANFLVCAGLFRRGAMLASS